MKSTDLFHCVTRDIESLVCSVVIGWFHSILQSLDWVNSHRAGNEHIVSPQHLLRTFLSLFKTVLPFWQLIRHLKNEKQSSKDTQINKLKGSGHAALFDWNYRTLSVLNVALRRRCQRVDGDQTLENVHEPTRCDKGRRRTSERDAFAERFMDATACTVKSLGSRVAPQTSARD